MALEDFFTLAEMKSGLSTLARVEELISLMQKQRDCESKNITDAARQWSAVGDTLAVTEDTDCLNHFLRLDGLCSLNEWLQEAQKWNKDTSDNAVNGLVTTLLATLERLPVDGDRLAVSGICATVERLIHHNNQSIKEKAKKLSDKWNDVKIGTVCCPNIESGNCGNKQPTSADGSKTEDGRHPMSPSKRENAEVSLVESTAKYGKSFEVHTSKDVRLCVSDENVLAASLNPAKASTIEEIISLGSSLDPNFCPQNLSVAKESICTVARLSSTACRGRNVGDQLDISGAKEASDGKEGMDMEVGTEEGILCKIDEKETHNTSSSVFSASFSAQKGAVERSMEMSNAVDHGVETSLKVSEQLKPIPQFTNFQDISKGDVLSDVNLLENSSQRNEAAGSVDDINDSGKEVGSKVVRGGGTVITNGSPRTVALANRKAESGLESKETEEMGVVRQVSLVVEQEIIDSKEPFSSSPKVNSGQTTSNYNPEPKDQSVIEEINATSSPRESQTVSSVDLGSVGKSDLNKWNFDLNEDICSEEVDCTLDPVQSSLVNLSAPKAVVASSNGAPSLPVCPLQFEGEMGWKGSAETSAFRRAASHLRSSDCGDASSGLKQKSIFPEIDLNVAETEHHVALNPTPEKQMHHSSDLPCGESSIEVNSRRAERMITLDLNRLGDEDISTNQAPPHWRLHLQSIDQSLSSASSSSSRQLQLPLRDFDLNDNPYLLDAGVVSREVDRSAEALTMYGTGSSRFDDSDVTIMGSRMTVERKDHGHQAHQLFVGNGPSVEAALPSKPTLPYAHGAGPAMPVPPAFYETGIIPHMDPRGSMATPRVLGSSRLNVAAAASTGTRPSFLSNLSGTTTDVGIHGPQSSMSGLDLNPSLTSMESGSREGGGSFKHLFMHELNNGSAEEQSRSVHPSSSSTTLTLKRKEPEVGWGGPFALGNKKVTTWWQ